MASPRACGESTRRRAGLAAGVCFAVAVAGFGAALDGYAQAQWPVALLGATGVPRAGAFNLLGFVVPGLLAAFVLLCRRGAVAQQAPWPLGLGWTLALLAAIAFAAQGLAPLDPGAPDAGRGRWHGIAWALWGLAAAAAGLALGLGSLRAGQRGRALGHGAAGGLVFALGWLAGDAVAPAVAQRLAFAAWFAWLAWVACERVDPG